MKKILLISYLFPPAASVGGQRAVRIANHLPRFGYSVDVLTTDPRSGEGNFDDGLLDLIGSDVSVHRVPARFYFGRDPWTPPPRGRPFRYAAWKMAAYAEWSVNPLDPYALWARDARDEAMRLHRCERYDALIASGPPFSPVVEAMAVSRATGIPLVADYRDLWAVDLAASSRGSGWRHRRHTRNALSCERRLVDLAGLLVFTNEDAADCYRRAYPESPASKFVAVPNAYEETAQRAAAPTRDNDARQKLTLLHTGSLAYGRATCAANLLRAIGQIREREGSPRLEAVFVGAGPSGSIAALGTDVPGDAFSEIERVSRREALELQHRADVLIALQAGDLGSRLAVPAKLFEYISARKPILGVLPEGPAAKIIREHDLGEVGDCGNVSSIQGALERLVGRLGEGYRPRIPECYSPRATMESLAAHLDRLLSDPGV